MGFLGSLFKKKTPPVETRPAAPAALNWRVTSVTKETPSTVSFEVDGSMDFKAGQFVLLRPQASMPWRAYSFSRAPGATLRLTVKCVPNGQVSPHLTSKLAAGDLLEVKGPYGQFVLPASFQRALFIAGGSGVTPFISMLQEQSKKGWPTPRNCWRKTRASRCPTRSTLTTWPTAFCPVKSSTRRWGPF